MERVRERQTERERGGERELYTFKEDRDRKS
jgi:hypothetical protein